MNISIDLTDIIVWTNGDEIDVIENDHKSVMKSLVEYRNTLNDSYPNDHLILLTNKDFGNGKMVFGRAYDIGMVCKEYSVSIVTYKKSHESKVGEIMAHEIAHIIGIYDDTIWCPGTDFVMSSFQVSKPQRTWSDCCLGAFPFELKNRQRSHCLYDKPRKHSKNIEDD